MKRYDKQNRKIEKLTKQRNEAIAASKHAEQERARIYSVLDGIMHESRRLNSEIAYACEELSKDITNKNYAQAGLDADDAFYASGLLSSRLTFADFEVNQDSIARQQKYSAGVYKKFDKARRILTRAAKRKHININLEGPSRNEIDVFPAFEMVPFVILDNAVKYSPDHQEIFITVTDNPTSGVRIQAIVSSIGPLVPVNELPELVKRGVRGRQASSSEIKGEGIGLYLADTLTRLVNGRMDLSSSQKVVCNLNGITYSQFIVTLSFR